MPPSHDIAEIEGLYRQHGPALVLFVAALSGDYGRAQDAVQQVFLKLIESGNLRQAEDKKSYLFACVRNAFLNDAKLRQRTTELGPDSAWFVPPDRDYAAERNLRNALSALSSEQREVIVMHVWGELTFSQIADLLKVSANTVASRYRYALTNLRESMRVKEDSCAKNRS